MKKARRDNSGLRTWIEIDRDAIKHNFRVFRKLISPRTKLMAVVKSNAYGHGLVDFSREMQTLGADFLGVDSITEARVLRKEGIELPILVLGHTLPELLPEAAQDDISITVSTFETLEAISKAKLEKPLKIHIKVDTGMHRQGFLMQDLPRVVRILNSKFLIRNSPSIVIEGLYTHFASAKNPAFPRDTQKQLEEFSKWVLTCKKVGIDPIVHSAATGGTMLFPQSHFDMVRVGMGLYGLWPAPEVRDYLHSKIALRPVLTWKSLLVEIKELPAGSRIGYDLTEELTENSTIGIVPVGYWHGYPRALSSIGRVMLGKKECRVLGRVSMDMLIIDITGAKRPTVGDEVLVMGGDDELPVSASGLSRALDASWYEVVTRLNPLIKRIYR